MHKGDSKGFSLLELLIGAFFLVAILVAVFKTAKTSSTGNMLGHDLSEASMRLNKLVDSLRGQAPGPLPKNVEQVRISGTDTTRWILFDPASGAPYTQPTGLLLLHAKYSWLKAERSHSIETSTLLNAQ